MSIDYYATLSDDPDRVLSIVDGDDNTLPLPDRNLLRRLLLAEIPNLFEEGPRQLYQLMWSCDGYIQIYVNESFIEITHGTGGDETLINVLESIFELLRRQGLHVFDPQSDAFIDGHGATVSGKSVKKRPPAPMFSCASCGEAIAAWQCINCSKNINDRCEDCHNELVHP